jgi:hypothetical protein
MRRVSTDGAFPGGFGDGFGCGIAERKQDLFRFVFFVLGKFGERVAECFHPKIFFAFGAIDAVDERRKINQFAAGVHEVEIEYLGTSHNVDLFRGSIDVLQITTTVKLGVKGGKPR